MTITKEIILHVLYHDLTDKSAWKIEKASDYKIAKIQLIWVTFKRMPKLVFVTFYCSLGLNGARMTGVNRGIEYPLLVNCLLKEALNLRQLKCIHKKLP